MRLCEVSKVCEVAQTGNTLKPGTHGPNITADTDSRHFRSAFLTMSAVKVARHPSGDIERKRDFVYCYLFISVDDYAVFVAVLAAT